jgi:hypothetical protein
MTLPSMTLADTADCRVLAEARDCEETDAIMKLLK